MAVDFPPLRPTQRSYVAGQYPTRTFKTLNKQSITRRFGASAADSTLSFEFVCTSIQEESLFNAYHAAKGDSENLNLPQTLFEGMSVGTQTAITQSLQWFFKAMPSGQSIRPGLSRLSVELEGRLT